MKILIHFPFLFMLFPGIVPDIEAKPVQKTGQPKMEIVDTIPDTTAIMDTIRPDSISFKVSADSLDDEVIYSANDSIQFDVVNQKVFLYGNAQANYQDIELHADYIEIDWAANLIIAKGLTEKEGYTDGDPVFKEGDQEFQAKRIVYNYKSKKGKITKLFTKEGEGYMHLEEGVKTPDDEIYGSNGKYTTCDHPNPHFYIRISKLKVIPNKVIAAGPSNLVIADVPLPLFLPFGIFPINNDRSSGILFPEFGDSELGFFLKNGGYYFAISDNIDLSLRGDIYSRGSWRGNLQTGYAKKYGFNGNLNINYAVTKFGERIDPGFSLTNDFYVKWT
ncbi:MAG: LPS-assembly protein LptD, partial [Bacteroidetes bacterium]|nr:LPS-assembly protein LptD [Bacteroidota bacterium]